jgi:hypothetical protein
VLSECPPENQFNENEAVLFYWEAQRKSLVQTGDKYKSRKLSKERLNALLCFNAVG